MIGAFLPSGRLTHIYNVIRALPSPAVVCAVVSLETPQDCHTPSRRENGELIPAYSALFSVTPLQQMSKLNF
ncbi:hypothetical protein JOB18_048268 [Solea senegalensis]|uniref:Uncharacterized protein n=1 Tax=Solea senegalensis TaxID=28829 RepID=A0AAV6SU44_SOLSE|nr:hypothetical protein JOB18_048268 [Solea senegalensis]